MFRGNGGDRAGASTPLGGALTRLTIYNKKIQIKSSHLNVTTFIFNHRKNYHRSLK